jgi:hypothetical protein
MPVDTPAPKTVNRPAAAPRPASASRVSRSPLLRGRARKKEAPPAAPLRSPYIARFRDALPKAAPPAAPAEKALPRPPAAAEGDLPAAAPRTAGGDPLFQQARAEIRQESRRQRRHPPAGAKRQEAVDAAALKQAEQIEQSSKEKSAAEMERIGSAQQGAARRFSAEGFKADLMKRVNAKAPRDEGEAKALAKEPPLQGFEQEFAGKVADEQGKVTGPLAERAAKPPSGGTAQKKEVEVPKAAPPPAPRRVDPKLAAPKPKAWWEISLKRESDRLDQTMRENRLTEPQLAESREPKFIETLELKREAQKRVAEAPDVYRQREAALLQAAQARTDASLAKGMDGMKASRNRAGLQVFAGQTKTETETERRQREIKERIDGIYADTVRDVKAVLDGMTAQVKDEFAKALKQQTEQFNSELRRRISDYYGDWRIDDDLFGPSDVVVEPDGSMRAMTLEERFGAVKGVKTINPDVYRIFLQEKEKFLKAMDTALDGIAANVEAGLMAAHNRIRLGLSLVALFKAGLSGAELAYATSLEEEVKLKFQTLESSIDDAREDLLQTLSDQYSENVQQLEKTLHEINDELKKGWLERAAEFIKTVARTIFQLADLLLTILVRMAHLIWDIVQHPIRFFETLVAGLMQGIRTFVGNIGTYLQEAFWTWVTGTTSAKGITLSSGSGPESLFGIVLQVLRLTPADLRASAERILGREFMQLLDKGMALGERALEPVTILLTKGPGALWQYIKEALADTVRSSFERIRESVFNTFIEKALKWIAGFFVPGGGFVKIVKAVLRAFQFVAENLERIRHFFDSVFDAMEAALQGRAEGVASRIVTGLKMGIVMALDFLAKQIGLGAIVDGVQRIIQSLRRPIIGAVEFLLTKLRPFAQKLIAKGKDLAARALGGDPAAPPAERLDRAMLEAGAAVNRYAGRRVGAAILRPLLAGIRLRHRLNRLDVVLDGEYWAIEGEVNPRRRQPTKVFGAGLGSLKTKVTYYPANRNRGGNRMVANPVGPDHPKGSKPSDSGAPAIWAQVNTRRPGSSQRLYVLGHLLNERLGGPGDTPDNLAPISFSMNARHYSQAEQFIVNNLGTKANPRWFYYEVHVVYPASARVISAAERTKGVVDAEGLLASRFDCEWKEMEEDPSKPGQLVPKAGGISGSKPVTHDIPPYPGP